MAKFDYIKAQKLAQSLIDKFGQKSPLVRVNSSYDAVTGVSTIDTYSITTATVCFLPASGGTVQAFDNRYREDLKKGKIRFFYVAARDLAFKPEGGDLIFFEGRVWDFAGATPLNPAGIHILSTVGCRQGEASHLGALLAAIAAATGNPGTPPEMQDPNILDDIITRIEALEDKGLIVNNW